MHVSFAGASCRRALPELIDEGVVTLQAGDALKDTVLSEHGPFDAIHVGASAGHIPKVSVLRAFQLPQTPFLQLTAGAAHCLVRPQTFVRGKYWLSSDDHAPVPMS